MSSKCKKQFSIHQEKWELYYKLFETEVLLHTTKQNVTVIK